MRRIMINKTFMRFFQVTLAMDKKNVNFNYENNLIIIISKNYQKNKR